VVPQPQKPSRLSAFAVHPSPRPKPTAPRQGCQPLPLLNAPQRSSTLLNAPPRRPVAGDQGMPPQRPTQPRRVPHATVKERGRPAHNSRRITTQHLPTSIKVRLGNGRGNPIGQRAHSGSRIHLTPLARAKTTDAKKFVRHPRGLTRRLFAHIPSNQAQVLIRPSERPCITAHHSSSC
jgi:hypothetical protein